MAQLSKLRKLFSLCLFLGFSCQSGGDFITWSEISDSPVLSPEDALRTFKIEDGFTIELVASEPMIHDPVAMEFDSEGNLWVVEMKGYMPNIEGTLEDVPNGSIKKLSDTDHDGKMDKVVTVLDNLVLPRAIKLIYGGLLYAEPPNLWFSELSDDRIVSKILVDSMYAVGGNVEHQPNGLLLGLDNWLYNAKSSKRYRKMNGKWIIEPTEYRGQWGISQTIDGLLAYNTNSNQLRGDFVAPSNIIRNPGIRRSKTTDREWVSDQRVYPIRPTSVNRGYTEGMLDSLGRLVAFTAACGPVIYEGDAFGDAYKSNAFVAEPSANLIKRNILSFEDIQITGKQTGGKEFLASTDERFRPVNLYNGPDGNLYVTDMYRGIIQHITYITNYLKEQSTLRNLDTPVGLGRIYRIKAKNGLAEVSYNFESNESTIAALGHPNMWVRMTAQQMLAARPETARLLADNIQEDTDDNFLVHAIWTLEAQGELDVSFLEEMQGKSNRAKMHVVRATRSLINESNYTQFVKAYRRFISLNDPQLNLEISLALGDVVRHDSANTYALASEILQHRSDELVAEALLSSLNTNEELSESMLSYSAISSMVAEISANKIDINTVRPPGRGSKGLYDAHCMTCHGEDGRGIQSLGPPLAKSEWVTGNKETLIAIVLYGMEGPIEVNGHQYTTPEIAPGMPGIRLTESLGNSNVTAILNYIRTHWGNDAETVNESDIQKIRWEYGEREYPFKAEEFN